MKNTHEQSRNQRLLSFSFDVDNFRSIYLNVVTIDSTVIDKRNTDFSKLEAEFNALKSGGQNDKDNLYPKEITAFKQLQKDFSALSSVKNKETVAQKQEVSLMDQIFIDMNIVSQEDVENDTHNNTTLVLLNKHYTYLKTLTVITKNRVKLANFSHSKILLTIDAIDILIKDTEFLSTLLDTGNDPIKFQDAFTRFKEKFIRPLLVAREIFIAKQNKIENIGLKEELQLLETNKTLLISELFDLNSNVDFIDEEEDDFEFNNSAQLDKLNEFADDDSKTLNERIAVLEETKKVLLGKVENIDDRTVGSGYKKNLGLLNSFFRDFSQLVRQKGASIEVDLESKAFTQNNISQMRNVFSDNYDVLQELDKVVVLQNKNSKQTTLISNVGIVLNRLTEKRNDLQNGDYLEAIGYAADASQEKLNSNKTNEVIEQIYTALGTEFSTKGKQHSLELPPNLEEFFKLDSKQAYDIFMISIIERINSFYDDAIGGGETSFEVGSGSDELWGNDSFFEITNHESHGLTTLKFFIENFPWERFISDDKNFSKREKINFRKKISTQFKYRILAIQNSCNLASEISTLYTGKSHDSGYWNSILSYFAQKGNAGGRQSWDQKYYFNNQHVKSVKEEREDVAFRELFTEGDGKETGWLMPLYENYFIHEIEKKYANKLQLNDGDKLKELKAQLSDTQIDGASTILGDLHKIIEAEFGVDRLTKDKSMIALSSRKALWNIINTLQIHQWDINGIHSNAGRVFNTLKYLAKAVIPGQGMNWRFMPLERAALPLEMVTYVGLKTHDQTGWKVFSEFDEDKVFDLVENSTGSEWDWTLDLIQRSLDSYTNLDSVEDYDRLEEIKKSFKDNMGRMNHATSKIAAKRIKKLSDKLSDLRGEKLQKAQSSIKQLQLKLNAYYEFKRIGGFQEWMEKKLREKTPTDNKDVKDSNIRRLARTYAITTRYKVIKMNDGQTGLGDHSRLPIAVPMQKYNSGMKDGFILIPMQALRDAQIDSNLIDFSKLPANPNSAYSAFMMEAYRWFGFIDATKHDAVFAEIHNSELQKKIRSLSPVFGQRHSILLTNMKASLRVINANKTLMKLGGRISRDKENQTVDSLLTNLDNLIQELDDDDSSRVSTSTVGKVINVLKKPITASLDRLKEMDNKDGYFKVGVALDALLRERISIAKIEASDLEDEVDEGGKSGRSVGMGFPEVNKYAGKYFFGKAPEFEIILEMFRFNYQGIHEFIHEAKSKKDGTKIIREELILSVPPFLRDAVDSYLNGNTGRAEKEFIVGCFWMAVQAYLDQYSLGIDDGDTQVILNNDERARFLATQKTTSGAKPMNYADRELFIHYVAAMIDVFDSPAFATGSSMPRNLRSTADVVAMMERRKIVGSILQIMIDLDFLENGGQKALKVKDDK